MSAADSLSGSARVSRAGDSESFRESRTFIENQSNDGARYCRRRLPHFEKAWAIYAVTIATKNARYLSPDARTIVLNALQHFHNRRYELFAACVMPDHVHLLLQPWPKANDDNGNAIFWSLSELMHSIKSFSAHRINELESKTGSVWEREQFDRYVRSDHDLQEKFHYILRNPWDSSVARQNQDYPWIWTQDDDARNKRLFRRDAETSTRDACATRNGES
jgi:REP element-mobilizing transposase RayT